MGEKMRIWCKSSAYTVFPGAQQSKFDKNSVIVHTAKNMVTSAQIFVQDRQRGIDILGWTINGLPDGVICKSGLQGYVLYNDGIPYPDKITTSNHAFIKPYVAQGILFRFDTNAEATVGSYMITVNINAHSEANGEEHATAYIFLNIHKTVIPSPAESEFGHEYFYNHLNFGINGESLLELYDNNPKMLAEYVKLMKDLRVNHLAVDPWYHLQYSNSKRIGKYEWQLDFSKLDNVVKFFLEHGSFNHIVINGIIESANLNYITSVNEDGNTFSIDLFGEHHDEAEKWAETYFSSVYKHFCEMGWEKMLIFHLADEPRNAKNWLWAREICRRCAPGIPCSEPLDIPCMASTLGENCDIPVARLENHDYESNYYKAVKAKGNPVWCYSCCYPNESGWLNKFIDLPTRYSRIIKWVCYSQNITGFLHWGFNWWHEDGYGLNPNTTFKGDGFIFYPDKENNCLLMSNRGLATIEGLEEWELLNMLGKKYKYVAEAISKNIGCTFNSFDDNPDTLDKARADILTMLDALE